METRVKPANPNFKFDINLSARVLDVSKDTAKPFSVSINNQDLRIRLKFILSLLCENNVHISIKFCDDEEIQSLNSTFRKKNKPTDVLSFPSQLEFKYQLTDNSRKSYVFLGDIIISLPTCFIQAKKYKNTFCAELERMLVHGITHLLGFDHERNKSALIVHENLEKTVVRELENVLGKPNWVTLVSKKSRKKNERDIS